MIKNFENYFSKRLQKLKMVVYLQPQLSDGLVVQLVRIHAVTHGVAGSSPVQTANIGEGF